MRVSPLVSVIIPVFNCDMFVEACIESVLRQSYKNLEIIIVNDGSTDKSPSIISRYAAADDRVIQIDKPNEGLVLARKTGLAKATGKYIQHLDADDELLPDAIQELVCRAEETQADIVAAQFWFCFPDREPEPSGDLRFDVLTGAEYYQQVLIGHAYWSVWSNFHKRTLYEQTGVRTVPEISYGEDAILMTQLILHADKVAALHRPTLNYNRYSSSMTGTMNKSKYWQLRAAEAWIRAYLAEKGLAGHFGCGLAHWQARLTLYSLQWRQFKYTTRDMRQIISNLETYPELIESLSRKELKIISCYRSSSLLGFLKVLVYRIKGKI